MDKDSQAKLGRTQCDFCDEPATVVQGRFVTCAKHSSQAETADGIKQGSVQETPLKSAGLLSEDLHS